MLAIYIDPSQPSAAPAQIYALLAVYIAVAAALAFIAASSWWWDHRLARPAHALDLLVFAAVVFATEGYTSPFFTFSLFIILSASIRWGGRQTVRSAITVNLFFLLSGLAADVFGNSEIDVQRLLIRSSYLGVLSLLCIWFAYDRDRLARRATLRRRLQDPAEDEKGNLPQLICNHVAARLNASRVVCVSRDEGEPWALVHQMDGSGRLSGARATPVAAALFGAMPDEPVLLDGRSGRMLAGTATDARQIDMPKALRQFAEASDLGHAIGITIHTQDFECAILAAGAASLSSDDLTTAAEVREELEFLVKQDLLSSLSQQAERQRVRFSIGRDLHDSVAQVVAGISFRLEGFKKSGKSATELAEDIEILQQELATEQRQLRSMIADLRRPNSQVRRTDVAAHLTALVQRLARQWDIACTFTSPADLIVAPDLERELNQMVREGVANAVRHGRADRVAIVLQASGSGLALEIIDNGRESIAPGEVRPRTLSERAAALSGYLKGTTGPEGTRIRVDLPMGAKA
ncbi:histidine kinase [Altererythrobacter sp. TH136]|uniref:sensor histidine kinase n=1 Tax=Altererythrobacter sp. TH136 TaxID=2067415 RepID=UPI00116365E3|nr:histidine kinase [Altererythrobacter sp. TH136]QDM39909.1 hypothetical protein C0V74_01715 [Altererythrobacter sp. TH136]